MKISRKIGIKRGLLGLILTSVVLGGFVVQAQFSRNAYVVNTVHLFPAQIDAEGWENYETLTFQNLDQYALLQEFNAINSATLREPGRRSTVESDDSVNQLKLQSVPAATSTTTTEPVSVSDGEIGATSTSGTSTSVQQNDMVPAATSTQVPDLSD